MSGTYAKEKETLLKIEKQGLDFEYKSDNPIASEFIKWVDECTKHKIEEINNARDVLTVNADEFIEYVKMQRCMTLEIQIEKISNTLTEEEDFKFFNMHRDLYKKLAIAQLTCNYIESYETACMLADFRREFNESLNR